MKKLALMTLVTSMVALFTSCSDGYSTAKEALLNYHRGIKDGDRERVIKTLHKGVSDFYIDLTMAQTGQYPYNFDIEWVKDSVVTDRRVFVFFTVKADREELIVTAKKSLVKENRVWVMEKY